jgi:MFS-type transporter involved in bile tolerance (Atg22 family)
MDVPDFLSAGEFVVAVVFVLVGRFREPTHYRKYITVLSIAIAIAVIAIYWVFQRIL